MNVFQFVIILVLLLSIAEVAKAWIKKRSLPKELPEQNQLIKQIDELESRVRVLERIVTEGKRDLSSQIEAL